MRRFLSIAILMLIAVATATAESLKIVCRDGTVTTFQFSELPVIKSVGRDLLITSSLHQIQLPMIDIERFVIDHSTTSIQSLEIESSSTSVISIYSTNGQLLRTNNNGSFSTNDLPQGIYIVRQGNHSYKIVVK